MIPKAFFYLRGKVPGSRHPPPPVPDPKPSRPRVAASCLPLKRGVSKIIGTVFGVPILRIMVCNEAKFHM